MARSPIGIAVAVTISLTALLAAPPRTITAATQKDTGTGGSTGTGSFNTNTANTNAANTNTANTNASNANAGTNVNRGLEAAKLRVCQNREAAINRIMVRMANRAERQSTVFSKIADRVVAFYVQRGRTLDTYSTLVNAVNAKKTAAEAQVTALKSSTTFSCTADNPSGLASAFKDKLRATTAALKDYKTTVKNLIVGVRQAQGQASSNGNANVNASNTNG